MGSWWRSEEMTYVCMVISEVAAPACIRELGVLGCIQFTDLNPEIPPFQRPHISTIKRCDEMERKIRYIHHISTSLDIRIHEAGSISNFLHNVTNSVDNNQGDISSAASILENIESQLNAYEAQLIDLEKYGKQLYVEYNAKVEFQHVLNKAILLYQSEMNSMSMNSPLGGHAHAQKDHLRGSARDHDDVEEHIELNSYHYNDGLAHGYENELSFSNLTGILPDSSERVRFERMIFRVTRGNCWLRFVNIDEQEMATENGYRGGNNGITTMSGVANNTKKCMFIIFYKSKTIHDKLKKVCDGFSARLYSLQSLDNPKDIEKQQVSNAVEVQESLMIFNKNLLARKQICLDVSLVLENWLWVIRREKAIYHVLNMCKDDLAAGLLICRGWILTSQIELTRSALNRAHMQANLPPSLILEPVNEPWPTPPTHFKTNKYTDGYQEFVNTYGIPRYREINPALFTAATFPFLFGIMYGDIGHGICLMLAGMYLILTEHVSEKRSTGEMLKGIYSARYMLFAMGVCAIYAGSVYNDYFSLGLNLFGSRYAFSEQLKGEEAIPLSTYGDAAAVYPYGIDPAWKIASNTLLFFNSFKMKLSVVLGIAQMTLGICLKGINALYFNQYLDFVCEFIPMLVFDLCFFGYMVVLIFVKWTINWDERMQLGTCGYTEDGIWGECNLQENDSCFTYNGDYCDSTTELLDMCPLGMGGTSNGCQPPNLITTLMNMALSPGIVNEPLYHGQASVQLFLLGVAFLCVPILLFAKPFILKRQHEQSRLSCTQIGNEHELGHTIDHEPHVDVDSPLLSSQSDHDPSMEHEFDFGEVFIHQAIETIEFVLGMVSNTASYLRLWALSLAHTELAEVFWSKALMAAIKTGSPVAIFFGFAIFAAVTFAVLLCMDVLECFLHALRLHWVEFQNKFYKADGYRFQPFDFYPIISKAIID